MTLAELRTQIDDMLAAGAPPETVVFVPRYNYYTGEAVKLVMETVWTQTHVGDKWVDAMAKGVVIR